MRGLDARLSGSKPTNEESEEGRRCANPDCCRALLDQPGGSVWMMELETSSREFIDSEDNGLPIPTKPVRYFWLCIDCREKFVLHRWTPSGVVLLPKSSWDRQIPAIHAEPRGSKPQIRFHASRWLEAELMDSA